MDEKQCSDKQTFRLWLFCCAQLQCVEPRTARERETILFPFGRRDAMSFDTSLYCGLSNSLLGTGQSLNVIPDGSGLLKMSQTGYYTGELWKLVEQYEGTYALRTDYLGDDF